ncbi:MAG: acyl-CoA dehydrogenase [Halobacteriovoraceae bacterium]|nr:acyl-CoA dehydrogenase [Peredibacter sp.]MBJ00372.1 acyl-CoA dehydrogenase [Halobacteriovoraceae bacterium]|tara:strand:+ start:1531 stop:2661 length:1131 start_codon:yes stop_codon:yes gene_type:complete
MTDFRQELINSVNKFCKDRIEPFMEEDDAEGKFRKEIFNEMGQLGLTGMTLPEQYGGAGLGYEDFCAVLEEIAKSSVPYAVTVSVSTMVQGMISNFGTEEQKQKYLPSLTSGEEIAAFCLSESHAGSDAGALKTTAKKTDGGYILNGSKMWITSGGVAKTYVVMARTGAEGGSGISAFILEDGQEGFSYGKKENKMGWRTSPTRELVFENCFVPQENILGTEGQGFKIAKSALAAGRITIGAIAVGLSQRSLDEAIKYSLERKQFNQPIFDFQGLQWMMADMATETQASRLMVQAAAQKLDSKKEDVALASMAKMKATDTAMRVTTDSVQIHGGVGYTTEYPVERYMRDAKVLQIVEGTNQVQKVVIARSLRKQYS